MSEEKRDKWEMPKPVFRQTSGSLPKGFIRKEASWDDSTAPNPAAPLPAAHDPKNDLLITMYAPPSDLAKKSLFESEIETRTVSEPDPPIVSPAAIEAQPGISEQFTVDQT